MGDKQFTITADGKLREFRAPSGFANGNALMKNGMVASAQHDRKLVALTPSGQLVRVLAETFNGKKLNSPNDVAVAADGSLWFTDPPMGITGYGPKKEPQELAFQGVFRLKGTQLSVMDDSLGLPNGIGFSPDGRSLYVSDTKSSSLVRFNVDTRTGQLSGKTVFATLERVPGGGKEGAADGLRVDRKGNVWASGPGGITVLSAKGTTLCQIPFENHVSNLSFGGRDGKSMVVTSADKVYIMRGVQPF
jgi:gluconolactonase